MQKKILKTFFLNLKDRETLVPGKKIPETRKNAKKKIIVTLRRNRSGFKSRNAFWEGIEPSKNNLKYREKIFPIINAP